MRYTTDQPDTCLHRDCTGSLMLAGDDPALPPHVNKYECRDCGEWYDHDTETGELEVDC